MSNVPSETTPFKSRFADNLYISAAQYLAEVMCYRMSRKNGKDLPPRFWQQTAWKRTYFLQVLKANALLKLYSQKAIFSAVRRLKWVYSLNNKMALDPVLQEEQEKLDAAAVAAAEKPAEPQPPAPVVTEKPREVYNPKQSMLGKLRSLDGC